MSAAPDIISVRNELYGLMLRCLQEGRLDLLDGVEEHLDAKGARAFLLDKAPRYRKALKLWFSRPRPRERLAECLCFSEILFNHGLYFDAHEYLESIWKASNGDQKICLQGLIQIAAGLHKLELDPSRRTGALQLLEKGLAKLQAAKEILGPETVENISRRLAPVLRALRRGDFALSQVPRLRWAASFRLCYF